MQLAQEAVEHSAPLHPSTARPRSIGERGRVGKFMAL